MRQRRFGALGVAATITAIVLLPLAPAVGQDVARTPWGKPDLSGIWDFRTMTPLERPDELVGKEVLTDDEAAEYERKRLRALDKDRPTASASPKTSATPTISSGGITARSSPKTSARR